MRKSEVAGALVAQILVGFETLELSVEMLAEQFDLEVREVRGVLLENSKRYREREKAEPADADGYLKELKLLAATTEIDSVKAKTLMFLIDEAKGRNDIASEELKLKRRQTAVGEVDLALRVKQFNDQIAQTRQIKEEILSG